MKRFENLTIIVPIYNESEAIDEVLPPLINGSQEYGWKIIAIDDGSTDDGWSAIQKYANDIMLLHNHTNMGYGASLKKGIRAAKTKWVATYDADGQHLLSDLIKLLEKTTCVSDIDGVFGQRKHDSHVTLSRVPGKWFLRKITNYLAKSNIVDINCGLRVIKRDVIINQLDLCSDLYSFSVSSLVALLKSGNNIIFVPVKTKMRIGKSSVKQFRDGFNILIMVLRLVTLFDPMRVFLPVAFLLFFFGLLYQTAFFIFYEMRILSATVLLGLASLFVFFMALVADQVASLRREMLSLKKNKTKINS